jgi:hypothetical protein
MLISFIVKPQLLASQKGQTEVPPLAVAYFDPKYL